MQHKRLWSALLVLVLVLLLAAAGPAFAQDDGPVDLAPSAEISTAIPGRYIVVFQEGVPAGAVDAAIAEAEVAAAAESLDAAGGRQALELHYRAWFTGEPLYLYD